MAADPLPESDSPVRASLLRRHPWLILFAMLALAIIVWVLTVAFHDIPAPDDHDVLPVFTGSTTNPLAEHQAWIETHPLIGDDKDISACLTPSKWNDELAEKLLRDNADNLAKFDAFIQTDTTQWRWRDREKLADLKAKIPYLTDSLHLMNLLKMRGIWQSKHQKAAESLDTGLSLLKYGQGIRRAQGNLICFLVGTTAQYMGVGILDAALHNSNFDASTLERCSQSIAASTSDLADARDALKVEYLFFKNAIDDTGRSPADFHEAWKEIDDSPHSQPLMDTLRWLEFKRNRTLLKEVQQIRKLEAAMAQDWTALNIYVDKEYKSPMSYFEQMPSGNASGQTLQDHSGRVYTVVLKKHFTVLAVERLVQVEIQLRLYELRHSHLPESMKALQTAAGNAIPPDPFAPGAESIHWNSAKPLRTAPPLEDKGDQDFRDLQKGNTIELKYWWPVPDAKGKSTVQQ